MRWEIACAPSQSMLYLTNTGLDTALKVEVVLYADGKRRTPELGDVIPDDTVELSVEQEWTSAIERNAEDRAARRAQGWVMTEGPRMDVSVRVSWLSFHGTPSVWDSGDFDFAASGDIRSD